MLPTSAVKCEYPETFGTLQILLSPGGGAHLFRCLTTQLRNPLANNACFDARNERTSRNGDLHTDQEQSAFLITSDGRYT